MLPVRPAPYGGHDWVFHSSLTDLDYTLTVLETETGRIRTYDAADSESLTCGRADTSAFERDCAAAAASFAAGAPPGIAARPAPSSRSSVAGFERPSSATDPRTGRTADGTASPKGDRFGYFSLPSFTGDPSFPEIFVKMADATAQPGGYFWVFHTGLTDLDYTLTVTDQVTGRSGPIPAARRRARVSAAPPTRRLFATDPRARTLKTRTEAELRSPPVVGGKA